MSKQFNKFAALFARKPLDILLTEAQTDSKLKRALGPFQLIALGLGAVIGVGIFVATGSAANSVAGPSLMISYVVAGITCIFAALCYAEFASMVPVAGSAYTYAYATMGEFFAWIIGWDLLLEYGVASAAVAVGWSSYFKSIVETIGMNIPQVISESPWRYNTELGQFVNTGSIINLPAALIIIIITAILIKGITESAAFNVIMVCIKLAAILFVIAVGIFLVNSANWKPFAPFGWTGVSFFGHNVAGHAGQGGAPTGMLAGAAIIFFAYIGFDSVSTCTEEAKNPRRDVPIGIVLSLLICTVLYVGMTAVLTGMVNYNELDLNAPVAIAFRQHGLGWAEMIISAAGVAGITSVLLVMMLSGPRIFLAMARDGLVPKGLFGAVHPKFQTPWKSSILIGFFILLLASFGPIDFLLHLTNMGTLLAFVIVCAAVPVMRYTHPDAKRPFKCPWGAVIPILGVITCLMLMFSLPVENWWRLFTWLGIGVVIYFAYGFRHSELKKYQKI